MNSQLQAAIDRRNRETAGARRQHFERKATDQKHHENLLGHVEVLVDALRKDIAAGMVTSSNLREALREIGPAIALSKKRLLP